MRRPRSSHRLVALATTVLLVAAGCGSDDSGDNDDDHDHMDTAAAGNTSGDPCGAPTEPLTDAADAPAAGGLTQDAAEQVPAPGDLSEFPQFHQAAIVIEGPDGESTASCVLLAASPEQRRRGLMEVTDLAGYTGMLFVAESEHIQSFWMRNTPMPLSIAWFDDNGALVSALDMEPCDDVSTCESYSSEGSARFALEVPQGELSTAGVVEGSTLTVGGV